MATPAAFQKKVLEELGSLREAVEALQAHVTATATRTRTDVVADVTAAQNQANYNQSTYVFFVRSLYSLLCALQYQALSAALIGPGMRRDSF